MSLIRYFLAFACIFLSASVNAQLDIVDIRDFGAISDDGLPDDEAIQSAINHAIANKKSVYLGSGTYNVANPLVFRYNSSHSKNPLKIFGEKQELTRIETSQPISVFKVEHRVEMSNFSISQEGASRSGIGIEVEFATYHSTFEKLSITGFDKGIYGKWLIWDRFAAITLVNVNTGIELHSNGEAPGGWNREPDGWFNNVISFDHILADECGIGLNLKVMGVHISNTTVQNCDKGIVLGGPSASRLTWNNKIENFYSEFVDHVFEFSHAHYISIDSIFVQGGSQEVPADTVLKATNVRLIEVKGSTGQDWWRNSAVLNSSRLIGSIKAIGGKANVDAASAYIKDNLTYGLDHVNEERKWVNIHDKLIFDKNKTYRITISGIRDGYAPVVEEYIAYFWSDSLSHVVRSAGMAKVLFRISGGYPQVYLDHAGGSGLSQSKAVIQEL